MTLEPNEKWLEEDQAAARNGHDPFGDQDWMIKPKQVTYFRGSQSPRIFTCMAQPDLGRPLNHA